LTGLTGLIADKPERLTWMGILVYCKLRCCRLSMLEAVYARYFTMRCEHVIYRGIFILHAQCCLDSLLSWCFVSLKKPNVEPGTGKKVSEEFQGKSLADTHNTRR